MAQPVVVPRSSASMVADGAISPAVVAGGAIPEGKARVFEAMMVSVRKCLDDVCGRSGSGIRVVRVAAVQRRHASSHSEGGRTPHGVRPHPLGWGFHTHNLGWISTPWKTARYSSCGSWEWSIRPQLDSGWHGVPVRRRAGVVGKIVRHWIVRIRARAQVSARTQLRKSSAASPTGLCVPMRSPEWPARGSLLVLRIDPDPGVLDRQGSA